MNEITMLGVQKGGGGMVSIDDRLRPCLKEVMRRIKIEVIVEK